MTDLPPQLRTARDTGLIQPETLLPLLGDKQIRLVDATYPPDPALPKIGNATLFDIDDIANPDAPLPHTLPPPELFASKVGQLGIGNNDFVIAYDKSGLGMAAARVWWMFRVFGHDNVAVLDGGLFAWLQENYPVDTSPQTSAPAIFKSSYRPDLVVDYDRMTVLSSAGSASILDARPADRFGPAHIPNSANLPALSLIGPDRRLRETGLTAKPDSKFVVTCGSGVTACVIALALFREGHRAVPVYDGSWSEWSVKTDRQ